MIKGQRAREALLVIGPPAVPALLAGAVGQPPPRRRVDARGPDPHPARAICPAARELLDVR